MKVRNGLQSTATRGCALSTYVGMFLLTLLVHFYGTTVTRRWKYTSLDDLSTSVAASAAGAFGDDVNNDEWGHYQRASKYCNRHNPTNHPSIRFLRNASRTMTVVDVGGHAGRTTFPTLLCFGIAHRVITVEPSGRNQRRLRSAARALGIAQSSASWKLVHGALSNETGTATFYVPGDYLDNGALHPASALNVLRHFNRTSDNMVNQEVKTYRGDDVLYNRGIRPDYIKIDVQGAEALVLQGMVKLLSLKRNLLVLSEHSVPHIRSFGLDPGDAIRFMTKLGFKAYCNVPVVNDRGNLVVPDYVQPITEAGLLGKYRGCGDVLYWKKGPAAKQ